MNDDSTPIETPSDPDEDAFQQALDGAWDLEGEGARRRHLFAQGVRHGASALADLEGERAERQRLEQENIALRNALQEMARVRSEQTICIVNTEQATAQWYALTPIERKVA